jgi:hypothetical protein
MMMGSGAGRSGLEGWIVLGETDIGAKPSVAVVVGGITGLGYAAIPKLSIAVVVDGIANIILGPSSPADPLDLGVPALE